MEEVRQEAAEKKEVAKLKSRERKARTEVNGKRTWEQEPVHSLSCFCIVFFLLKGAPKGAPKMIFRCASMSALLRNFAQQAYIYFHF